jgi:hypothetical protein
MRLQSREQLVSVVRCFSAECCEHALVLLLTCPGLSAWVAVLWRRLTCAVLWRVVTVHVVCCVLHARVCHRTPYIMPWATAPHHFSCVSQSLVLTAADSCDRGVPCGSGRRVCGMEVIDCASIARSESAHSLLAGTCCLVMQVARTLHSGRVSKNGNVMAVRYCVTTGSMHDLFAHSLMVHRLSHTQLCTLCARAVVALCTHVASTTQSLLLSPFLLTFAHSHPWF